MAYHRPPPPPPPSTRPDYLPPPYTSHASHPAPTPQNTTLLQSFEWHTPSTPQAPHYNHLNHLLPSLIHDLGITHIWLPPGCKANNPSGAGNGYDVYDLWDLGEFDQKWQRSTKWGSKEELENLVESCRRQGVEVVWDAVLGHRTAGDEVDGGGDGKGVWAVEVDACDRNRETCAPKKIMPWLRFNFPGRIQSGNTAPYSSLQWRSEHFSAVDWCDRDKRNAIFKLISDPATHPRPNSTQLPFPLPGRADAGMNRLARFAGKILPGGREQARRPGKGWAEDVDLTNGNNNYLMFSSVDYAHSDVRADVLSWCKWMLNENGVGGFRLDAAQHISRSFLRELIHIAVNTHRQEHFGRDPFFVGEVWQGEVSKQIDWLDAVTPSPDILIRVYDTPLVNNFARISSDVSSRNPSADLRTILCNPSNPAHAALVGIRPAQAVTLVANHDTQAGQCMETHITPDMKALFYAFILLRQEGTPCVFWGDLFGTQGPRGEGPSCQVPVEGDGEKGQTRSTLPTLCLARSLFAYGEQRDYFDAADCIGWTRSGTWDRPGCVVLLSIGIDGTLARKRMWVNRGHGQRCVDLVCGRRVEVGGDGWATFEVSCRGVGVWVREGEKGAERFPVEMEGTGRR